MTLEEFARGAIAKVDELHAQLTALKEENEKLRIKTSVSLGVGDGQGNLFVHGDYDSIKTVQAKIFELEKLRAKVAELEGAAIGALVEIRAIIGEAYNSAYPICCQRPGRECCGNPEPEWQEFDKRMMDRLVPHEQALSSALSNKESANEDQK